MVTLTCCYHSREVEPLVGCASPQHLRLQREADFWEVLRQRCANLLQRWGHLWHVYDWEARRFRCASQHDGSQTCRTWEGSSRCASCRLMEGGWWWYILFLNDMISCGLWNAQHCLTSLFCLLYSGFVPPILLLIASRKISDNIRCNVSILSHYPVLSWVLSLRRFVFLAAWRSPPIPDLSDLSAVADATGPIFPDFRDVQSKAHDWRCLMGQNTWFPLFGVDRQCSVSQIYTPIRWHLRGDAFWLVGHKWFTSAPMSDAFLTLAQSKEGVSCFVVPRWRPDGRSLVAIQGIYSTLLIFSEGNALFCPPFCFTATVCVFDVFSCAKEKMLASMFSAWKRRSETNRTHPVRWNIATLGASWLESLAVVSGPLSLSQFWEVCFSVQNPCWLMIIGPNILGIITLHYGHSY